MESIVPDDGPFHRSGHFAPIPFGGGAAANLMMKEFTGTLAGEKPLR
jgi:hypothetical protein